jgi:hypothetical protein
MSEHHYIPLDQLDAGYQQLIPEGANILYTTRAEVLKRGMGAHKKSGSVAITDQGIAFYAAKTGLFEVSFVSMAAGALAGFIPWANIEKFGNYKDKIQVKHTIPDTPKKKLEWFFKAERCKNQGEEKKDFEGRKKGFGPFVEALYKQNK